MSDDKLWLESINDLIIDEDKVKNFYYPIIPGETINFRESLAVKLVSLFKELKNNHNSYFDECVASLFGLVTEVVNIYYTLLLKIKLEQKNFEIIPDQNSRLLKNIIFNKKPDFPKVLKQLIKGREEAKKRYFLFRFLRNLIFQKKIKKTFFKFPDFNKDIICIGDNLFLEHHAQFESKRVYYLRLNEWFKKLNQPNGTIKDLDFVINNILQIVFDEFKGNKIILSQNLQIYLREFIELLLLKLSIYKKSILDSDIGIPKTIWTPSGGGIFANIFRQVCKSNGSKVVGHAHGSGTGFFTDYGRTTSILEYQSCTDFFVYTKKSIEEYKKYSREDLIIDGKLPNIKCIDNHIKWPNDNLKFFEKIFSIKKNNNILYIPSIFINDGYFDGKLIDSHNTYNWLIILSNFLKKNNFNFKVKLHPSNKPPDQYVKYYKKNISYDSLAKSINNCSLIVTDQPSSSSFAASIVSNKPIIFIDLKIHNFSDYGLDLLRDRCTVIEANFTKKGINLDWDLLKSSIKNPKMDFSNEFKHAYLENVV